MTLHCTTFRTKRNWIKANNRAPTTLQMKSTWIAIDTNDTLVNKAEVCCEHGYLKNSEQPPSATIDIWLKWVPKKYQWMSNWKKWIQALKKLPPLQQQYTAQTCRANKKGNILNLCSWKPNKFAKTCNTTTAILVRLLGNRFPCTYVCMGFMFVLYFRRILCVYECGCMCATTWRVTSVFMVSMVFLLIQTQYRKSNITCDVRTPWCYN